MLNSAVRRVLGEANQQQIVRDERDALMAKIKEQVNAESAALRRQVVDARIRRADLPQQISEKVYGRMQSERQREAAEYRAQGSEQAQKITANADRDVDRAAGRSAAGGRHRSRGEGDADRNRIFAEAFGKDPDFFAFYRSMQAYEAGLQAAATRASCSSAAIGLLPIFRSSEGNAALARRSRLRSRRRTLTSCSAPQGAARSRDPFLRRRQHGILPFVARPWLCAAASSLSARAPPAMRARRPDFLRRSRGAGVRTPW